jgi:hypothetical protein
MFFALLEEEQRFIFGGGATLRSENFMGFQGEGYGPLLHCWKSSQNWPNSFCKASIPSVLEQLNTSIYLSFWEKRSEPIAA